VQYQGHHASHVASRAQEGKGGKNKITRNEGGAFIIVVKLLRTDYEGKRVVISEKFWKFRQCRKLTTTLDLSCSGGKRRKLTTN